MYIRKCENPGIWSSEKGGSSLIPLWLSFLSSKYVYNCSKRYGPCLCVQSKLDLQVKVPYPVFPPDCRGSSGFHYKWAVLWLHLLWAGLYGWQQITWKPDWFFCLVYWVLVCLITRGAMILNSWSTLTEDSPWKYFMLV